MFVHLLSLLVHDLCRFVRVRQVKHSPYHCGKNPAAASLLDIQQSWWRSNRLVQVRCENAICLNVQIYARYAGSTLVTPHIVKDD